MLFFSSWSHAARRSPFDSHYGCPAVRRLRAINGAVWHAGGNRKEVLLDEHLTEAWQAEKASNFAGTAIQSGVDLATAWASDLLSRLKAKQCSRKWPRQAKTECLEYKVSMIAAVAAFKKPW
jgi:hypothetical protein